MIPSVSNKKASSTPSSHTTNPATPPLGQSPIPAKPVTPVAGLSGTKSPIAALAQKSVSGVIGAKSVPMQALQQNIANLGQSIPANRIIQVSNAAQLKTVQLPGQLRGTQATIIRPPTPTAVTTGLRPSVPGQPVISIQRPTVPGTAALRMNTVATTQKTVTTTTATQGTTPTQYALVRAQIPGTGGGPPQTVTFIRAISPGGQPGGATVTVTPQQMAQLLRGQKTALKGAAQPAVRNVSPSTQGSTTAGLATIKPPSVPTSPLIAPGNAKAPASKQIIQIAAAQLANKQAMQGNPQGLSPSPGAPVIAKVSLSGASASPVTVPVAAAVPSQNVSPVVTASQQPTPDTTPVTAPNVSSSKPPDASSLQPQPDASQSHNTASASSTSATENPASKESKQTQSDATTTATSNPVDSTTTLQPEKDTASTEIQKEAEEASSQEESAPAKESQDSLASSQSTSDVVSTTTKTPDLKQAEEKEEKEEGMAVETSSMEDVSNTVKSPESLAESQSVVGNVKDEKTGDSKEIVKEEKENVETKIKNEKEDVDVEMKSLDNTAAVVPEIKQDQSSSITPSVAASGINVVSPVAVVQVSFITSSG